MKGLTFDIHRFSLNDGPGIRTTVFLKGCYLQCEWCHNPESQSFKPELSFNTEKCIDCFECTAVCPNQAHEIINNKHIFNRELCCTSGSCVDVCSSGALKIIGTYKDTDLILTEVMKDKKYYDKTGGGITISGGEPLAQFDFTRNLLRESKKKGLHTVVDTCGFADPEHYDEIIHLVDLFLFDYKLTADENHIRYTGVSNDRILSNLDLLYKRGASIVLRCPLIPGINDNEEHLEGITEMIKKYPLLKSVEIMPFHNMGKDKAIRIGKEYKSNTVNAEKYDIERWVKYFADKNCKVLVN